MLPGRGIEAAPTGRGEGKGKGINCNNLIRDPPLSPVSYFKYLGRVLLESNDEWPGVVRNLQRELQKWARLNRVSGREGADAHTFVRIYVAVVQAVFLYGLET